MQASNRERMRNRKIALTLLDSSSPLMVSAMYLTPSMALCTSGCLMMGDWNVTEEGTGFPEMSEMSKSAGKGRLSFRSSDGRFMEEKNMKFGMVSMKICSMERGCSD